MFPNKVTVFIPIKRAIIAKAKMHQQINLQNSLVSGNVIEITNFRDEKTYTWNSTNFNKRKKALQTLQVKKVFFFLKQLSQWQVKSRIVLEQFLIRCFSLWKKERTMILEEIEMKTIFWDQLDRVIISPGKQTAFSQSHVTHVSSLF